MRRIGAATVLLALMGACGGGSPSDPSYVDISGAWSASGRDSTGPGAFSLQLTQSGSEVSGSVRLSTPASCVGTASGSISGSRWSFRFETPSCAGCRISIDGAATVSENEMIGEFTGTNSCSGRFTDGHFTASRAVMALALTGRWAGSWGSDNLREVLVISQSGSAFSGSSFFENRSGRKEASRQGSVSGTLNGASVDFTLSRDGLQFHWSGMVDAGYRTLTGRFAGAAISVYQKE